VTRAVLDDHLLRDLLSDDVPTGLRRILRNHEPATTNLYYLRLCRSAVVGQGGQLTGHWPAEQRRALAGSLVQLPEQIEVLPMRALAFSMAELATAHRLSNLGAEAVAAAREFEGPLCVWSGDDGPGIRACAQAQHVRYQTVER
jgi:hypothetical protein